MRKLIIFIIIAVIVGAGVYYASFYFRETRVQEEIPKEMLTNIKTLRRGNFEKIDIIHGGSGKALLLEDATGHKLLRFENFEVTNGPDLYVYLSRNLKPTGDTESLGDFINLGPLKGSKGNQNYEINQNIDGYNTAVIWCKQFGVLFSFAVLQ